MRNQLQTLAEKIANVKTLFINGKEEDAEKVNDHENSNSGFLSRRFQD